MFKMFGGSHKSSTYVLIAFVAVALVLSLGQIPLAVSQPVTIPVTKITKARVSASSQIEEGVEGKLQWWGNEQKCLQN